MRIETTAKPSPINMLLNDMYVAQINVTPQLIFIAIFLFDFNLNIFDILITPFIALQVY